MIKKLNFIIYSDLFCIVWGLIKIIGCLIELVEPKILLLILLKYIKLILLLIIFYNIYDIDYVAQKKKKKILGQSWRPGPWLV